MLTGVDTPKHQVANNDVAALVTSYDVALSLSREMKTSRSILMLILSRVLSSAVVLSLVFCGHLLFSLAQTLTVTCTCCYDVEGVQDLEICSHADSLMLSRVLYPPHVDLEMCVFQMNFFTTSKTYPTVMKIARDANLTTAASGAAPVLSRAQ